MSRRLASAPLSLVAVIACCLCLVPGSPAGEPKNEEPSPLNDLSMEVAALQTLDEFDLTPEQMESLRQLAPETVQGPIHRQAARASEKYRHALADLRDALVKGDDDERISLCEDKVDELSDEEELALDDGVEITDAARQRAPEVLRLLTTRQVESFLHSYGEDLPDPLERMVDALDQVGNLEDAEWKDLCEGIVADIGWELGGLDKEKVKDAEDKVQQWLGKVRALRGQGMVKQRPDLEKAAGQVVGQASPTQVLQNITERALAELLSNPGLSPALKARLNK